MAIGSWFPATLTAGDVTLRRGSPADAPALAESVTASLAHLAPWMPWAVAGYGVDDAAGYLRGTSLPEEASYLISVGGVGGASVAGSCGLHDRVGPGALEIGYWVDVRHLRRGLASTAAALLTEAAFASGEIDRVHIHHDRANTASGAIPAALGFTMAELDTAEAGQQCRWILDRRSYPASGAADLLAGRRDRV